MEIELDNWRDELFGLSITVILLENLRQIVGLYNFASDRSTNPLHFMIENTFLDPLLLIILSLTGAIVASYLYYRS